MTEENNLEFSIEGDASNLTSALENVLKVADEFVEKIQALSSVPFGKNIEDGAKTVQESLKEIESSASSINEAVKSGLDIDWNRIVSDNGGLVGALESQMQGLDIDWSQVMQPVPIEADTSPFEAAVDNLSTSIPPVESEVSVNTSDLPAATEAIEKTDQAAEGLRTELGTPYVITAGDIINTFDSLSSKITEVESKMAGFNQTAAGVSLINGQSEQSAKDMAVAISDEDMSIQDALASEKLLAKQHVDSETQMKSLLESWKAFGNANDEQASSLMTKLQPAWSQFNVSTQDQTKYMDVLTELFQTTNVSSGDFSNAIVKNGSDLSKFGLSLDQVARLYLTMEEAGLKGRKGASELSGAISDVNNEAEETGQAVPKGTDALDALIAKMGIAPEKAEAASKAFDNAQGAVDRWSEAMDKGDTASEKLEAKIDKITFGINEMVTPLAPAAAGFAELAKTGAELSVFDAFLLNGRIASGLKGISSEIPLIGSAAAGSVSEVGLLEGALAGLGPAGLIAAGAVTVIGAAYATNFGGFADNINKSLKEAEDAISAFGNGDYEEAGKDAAQSVADGFGAVGDLIQDAITNIPELAFDAGRLLAGLNEGLGQVAQGGVTSFTTNFLRFLNAASVDINGFCSKVKDAVINFSWVDAGNAAGKAISDAITAAASGVGIAEKIGSDILNGKWESIGGSIWEQMNTGLLSHGPLGDVVRAGEQGVKNFQTNADQKGSTGDALSFASKGNLSYGAKVTSQNPSFVVDNSKLPSTLQASADAVALHQATTQQITAISLLQDKYKISAADAQKMYESSSNVRDKYDSLAKAKNDEIAASKESASTTKSAAQKIKTYSDTASALADTTLENNASFKVGNTEYKKAMENVNGKLQYVAEEQSAAAELTRKQAELDTQTAEKNRKDQEAESKKITDAREKYVSAIEKAAFDYQQSVKYATSTDQVTSAKTTYQKKLDEIQFNASQEGVSIDGLNTSMQVNSETINQLKSVYASTNSDLKTQLTELQTDRYQKLLKNPLADVSSIDKKIAEVTSKINANKQAIDSANSAITQSIDAQNKIASVYTTTGDKIVSQADKIANVTFHEEGTTPDLLTKLGQSKADSQGKYTGYDASWYTTQLKSWLTSIADNVTRNDTLRGSSAGAIEYDLQQQLTGSLKANTKGQGVSTAEIQSTVDQFVSEYLKGNQQIISSAEQARAKTSQIALSTSDYSNALSKLSISTDQQSKLESELSSILQSGNTSIKGASEYLGQYNSATQTYTQYSQDQISAASSLLKANEEARKAQTDYNNTLQKTGDPTAAAAAANADLTQANKDLAAAGVSSADDISKLPPALQSLAQFAEATINVINSSISKTQGTVSKATGDIFKFGDAYDASAKSITAGTAQIKSTVTDFNSYITSSKDWSGKFKADSSVPTSRLTNTAYNNQNVAGSAKAVDLNSDNIHCVFYDSNLKVPDAAVSKISTDIGSMNKSYIEQVRDSWGLNSMAGVDTGQLSDKVNQLSTYDSALQNTGSILGSTIPAVNTNLSSLDSSIQNLASIASAAVSQINAAISQANSILTSAASAVNSRNNLQSGEFSGPQTTTQHFATGGPVTQTGKADVEAGEWILRRDQVRNLQTGGGPQVNLSVNMQNSKFGDAEMSKTLPKQIARETYLRLKRAGAI